MLLRVWGVIDQSRCQAGSWCRQKSPNPCGLVMMWRHPCCRVRRLWTAIPRPVHLPNMMVQLLLVVLLTVGTAASSSSNGSNSSSDTSGWTLTAPASPALQLSARPHQEGRKRALLVVDVQGCFLPGGVLPTLPNEQLIANINALCLLGNFSLAVFTQDWHPPGHVSFAQQQQQQPGSTVTLQYTRDGRRCHPDSPGSLQQQCSPGDRTTAPSRPHHQHARRSAASSLLDQRHGNITTNSSSSSSSSSKLAGGHGSTSDGSAAPVGLARCDAGGANTTDVEQVLWPEHCVQHTQQAALHPGLIVLPTDLVLRKGWQPHLDAYSAFSSNAHFQSTGLAGELRRRGISALVIAGVALDFCVLASALDAAAAGFDTAVVRPATAAVSAAGEAGALRLLRTAGVRVVESVWEVVLGGLPGARRLV